jgi:hypothetical protein
VLLNVTPEEAYSVVEVIPAENVCSPVNVFAPKRARVPVVVGNVSVPVFVIVEITGAVNVLFVSVSVVARPTKVSEVVGNVRVALPLPTMVTFPPLIPNVRDVVPPLISNPFELFVISRLTDDCFAMSYLYL